MAINFHPTPGMVLMCDFRGSVAPEIWKVRPVVVISSDYFHRAGLSTIVPLSTKRPTVISSCHVRLLNPPYPLAAHESWAKCDLVMSVSHSRLDRVRIAPGNFVIGAVTRHELRMIRFAAASSFGVEVFGRRK
jgi:uncharacterized protein YifN (PemK superfamily)